MASEFSLARDNYVAQHVHTSRFLGGWLAVRQPDLHWQRIQIIELLLEEGAQGLQGAILPSKNIFAI